MTGEAILIYERFMWEPATGQFLVAGLDLAFVGAIVVCLRRMGQSRRALQRAKASIRAGAPLAEGQRFVTGKVEFVAGAPSAVEVTVAQEGSEVPVGDGEVRHYWAEIDREIDARPFYVAHASGERVRVEVPDKEHVQLVDRLDQQEWTERNRRRLRAALSEGEDVFVEGRLERGHDPEGGASAGYGDAAAGWVMRPQSDGWMYLSAEPLTHRHELRLRALERVFLLLIVGWAVAQAPLATFRLRQLSGHDSVAEYVGKREYTTEDVESHASRSSYEVFYVVADASGAPAYEFANVDSATFRALPSGPSTILVRNVPHVTRATALGRGPSLGPLHWLGGLIVALLSVARLWRVLSHKRWYERPFVEKNVSGPLPTPPGTVFRRAP